MHILKIKTKNREIGTLGERIAKSKLRRKGFRPICQSYIAEGHEIDLIMESRDTRIFVEVKTRTVGSKNPYGLRPADAVNEEKMRGIITAAKKYSALHPADLYQRFDVVEVYLDEKRKLVGFEHLEGAFTLDSIKKKHTRR